MNIKKDDIDPVDWEVISGEERPIHRTEEQYNID